MPLAVYGKHPARGDFLEHGLPPPVLHALELWLDRALSDCRSELGEDWPRLWAAGPALRFWCGEALAGQVLAGVMLPSQDKLGRRFPLLVLTDGLPPPSVDPDQGWYDRAEAHLRLQGARDTFDAPAALLDGLAAPDTAEAAPGPADFWAMQPGADAAALLADIALTDHRRAAAGRSYWWAVPQADPGWTRVHAGEGLPGGAVLAWFLREVSGNG